MVQVRVYNAVGVHAANEPLLSLITCGVGFFRGFVNEFGPVGCLVGVVRIAVVVFEPLVVLHLPDEVLEGLVVEVDVAGLGLGGLHWSEALFLEDILEFEERGVEFSTWLAHFCFHF